MIEWQMQEREFRFEKWERKDLAFNSLDADTEGAERMLTQFSKGHADILGICDHLEDIADTLLPRPEAERCDQIASNLLPNLRQAYQYEEDILFPWLVANRGQEDGLNKSLTRLYFEHLEDEAYGGEVVEMLRIISAQKKFEAETAGYMFRGFFEGMRRHIAFEQDYLYRLISPLHRA